MGDDLDVNWAVPGSRGGGQQQRNNKKSEEGPRGTKRKPANHEDSEGAQGKPAKKHKKNKQAAKEAAVEDLGAGFEEEESEGVIGGGEEGREAEGEGEGGAVFDFEETNEQQQSSEKRKKKRNKMNQKLKEKRSPLLKLGDLSKVKKEATREYFWGLYKSTFPNKVEIELEEAKLEDSYFKDSYPEEHTDGNYTSFLKKEFPSWKKYLGKPKLGEGKPGRPIALIVASSAIRCVGILKHLKDFHEQCKIGKLFAKHLKIEDQQKMLEENFVKIAVGTPNRLEKLAESGALKLDDLALVVIDMHADAKEKTILEIPEVRKDLFLFIQNCCLKNLSEGKTKISLY